MEFDVIPNDDWDGLFCSEEKICILKIFLGSKHKNKSRLLFSEYLCSGSVSSQYLKLHTILCDKFELLGFYELNKYSHMICSNLVAGEGVEIAGSI